MSTTRNAVDEDSFWARSCVVCGRSIAPAAPDGRCPQCAEPPPPEPVTSDDSTPYARSESPGLRSWFSMCLWVCAAGSERLAHLSLIRRSAASTRFTRRSLLAFALAAALFATPHCGWREVVRDPSMGDSVAVQPSGNGWVRIVAVPAERPLRPGRLTPVAVWWNLKQAAIAVPATFVVALLGGWLILAVVSFGMERSLIKRFRGQGRFGAAVRYGSAWVFFPMVGGVVSLLLLLSSVGSVTGWWFAPPRAGVYLAAAAVASVGFLMWWFWLIRVASTAPPPTRARVVAFFAIWTPLLATGIGAAWVIGLHFGMKWLAPTLRLQW